MRALFCLLVAGLATGCVDIAADDPRGPETRRAPACEIPNEPITVSGDHSLETIVIRINSSGPFRVAVPLPVADPETTFSSWLFNLSHTPQGDVRTSDVITTRGRVLVVESDAPAAVCSQSLQFPYLGNRCCAEAYLDAAWTTRGDHARPDSVPVRVDSGLVDVTIEYRALSDYCGRDAEFSGKALGPGWQDLAGSDGAWCT